MNQSTASTLRKLAGGAALAFGVAAMSSSTACSVSISCPIDTCDGVCTDTSNDDFNCGACGNECLSTESCVGGACVGGVACTPDLGSCVVDSDCCASPVDGRSVCAGDNKCGCVAAGEIGCAQDSDCCDPNALCQADGSCQ
ncbi:MAG TPA: hypothetical protein VGH28_32765 [Polyangiaceae bacterium]|jgi:hypothetical protein